MHRIVSSTHPLSFSFKIVSMHVEVALNKVYLSSLNIKLFNPFAPGDFAEKRVLKLVEWFSGHCRAIKS